MRLFAGKKLIPMVVAVVLVLAGCAKKQVSTVSAPPPGSGFKEKLFDSPRMLTWYAQLIVEVDQVEEVIKQVESMVEKNNGYIENNRVSLPDHADFTLRVPSGQLKGILDQFAQLGLEKSRYLSSEDVTEKYIDTDARLKNAISLRDRLKTLLNKADKVSDILDIEKELTRIQSEIDSMEGILKALQGKVDYATVDLSLKQKTILGPLGYVAKGIGWIIQKLFVIR